MEGLGAALADGYLAALLRLTRSLTISLAEPAGDSLMGKQT